MEEKERRKKKEKEEAGERRKCRDGAREGDARVEKRVVARKRGRTIGGGEEWREWRAGV